MPISLVVGELMVGRYYLTDHQLGRFHTQGLPEEGLDKYFRQ